MKNPTRRMTTLLPKLSAAEEDEASAVFSRRGLQVLLWYELPRKRLIGPEGHQAVVEALRCSSTRAVGAETSD
jgi:hypothetical protein